MLLLFTSFLAGMLTVLAPCVLPILPIVLGGSVGNNKKHGALVLIGALTVSIVLFTLILRASTALIDIPASFWTSVSGIILILFGLTALFPKTWEKIASKFSNSSHQTLHKAGQAKGWKKNVLLGFSLGPVFTSCSPTYSLILATVLPASFAQGVFYTIVYALGLASVLLLIAFLGQKFTKSLRGISDPNSWFKRSLGILFLLVGLSILFGWDKDIEAFIIEQGYFGVTELEENLVERLKQ